MVKNDNDGLTRRRRAAEGYWGKTAKTTTARISTRSPLRTPREPGGKAKGSGPGAEKAEDAESHYQESVNLVKPWKGVR